MKNDTGFPRRGRTPPDGTESCSLFRLLVFLSLPAFQSYIRIFFLRPA